MSLLNTGTSPPAAAAVLIRQVEALDAWNIAQHQRERMLAAGAGSREQKLDAARRMQVLHHAHRAVLKRTADFLAQAGAPVAAFGAPRAVIAHPQQWLVTKLSEALKPLGVAVVGVTTNGAEALGLTVAEQPELLFIGDTLAMMSPGELLAEAALFSPYTVLAAQVAHGGLVGDMLDAGAHSVVTRRLAPDDVAATLSSLVPHPA